MPSPTGVNRIEEGRIVGGEGRYEIASRIDFRLSRDEANRQNKLTGFYRGHEISRVVPDREWYNEPACKRRLMEEIVSEFLEKAAVDGAKPTSSEVEREGYAGLPCTCTSDCPTAACKGGCGCEACSAAYGDFLSSE